MSLQESSKNYPGTKSITIDATDTKKEIQPNTLPPSYFVIEFRK